MSNKDNIVDYTYYAYFRSLSKRELIDSFKMQSAYLKDLRSKWINADRSSHKRQLLRSDIIIARKDLNVLWYVMKERKLTKEV